MAHLHDTADMAPPYTRHALLSILDKATDKASKPPLPPAEHPWDTGGSIGSLPSLGTTPSVLAGGLGGRVVSIFNPVVPLSL